MSSSLSLLDLVNHLHKLESSVGQILIEAAVKLSQLTDLNLFLIVESQEGRKFAGTAHLCDAYLNSALNPVGNDVRVRVNENESVVEQPPSPLVIPNQTNANSDANEVIDTPLTHSVEPPAGTGRPASSVLMTMSADRKRRSVDADERFYSDSKSRRLNESAQTRCDDGVKQEIDCQVISDEEAEVIDDVRAFDSFIRRDSDLNSGLHMPVVHPMIEPRRSFEPTTAIYNVSAQPEDAAGADDWRLGGTKMFIGPFQPPIILTESLCHKMRGLKSINNRNLFDKSSTEYRLFASTVYDFGKLIFHYAPPQKDIKDLSVLAFITECVEGFLKQHPFLMESEMNECKVNGLTITGFIRDRVKGGFKKLLRHAQTTNSGGYE